MGQGELLPGRRPRLPEAERGGSLPQGVEDVGELDPETYPSQPDSGVLPGILVVSLQVSHFRKKKDSVY